MKCFSLLSVCLLFFFINFIFGYTQEQQQKTQRFFNNKKHTNNWAVLVCTSRFWFNYRHIANTLSFYQIVKNLGIPDSNIILMLADDIGCNARNSFPAQIFNSRQKENNLYPENVQVDYRNYEVTVENFLRVLLDRHDENVPRSKRLLSDEHSNILLYLTGHGGEDFLKFQDQEEISSMDLADAFSQMHVKKRYNEILFISDTCQGQSLYSSLYTPNVMAISSSRVGENSYSHHFDTQIGISILDRFTYYTLMFFKERHGTIGDLMRSFDPNLIQSHPNWKIDLMKRSPDQIPLTDFFGSDLKISPIHSTYKMNKPKNLIEEKIEKKLKKENKQYLKVDDNFSFSFEKEFYILSLVSMLSLSFGGLRTWQTNTLTGKDLYLQVNNKANTIDDYSTGQDANIAFMFWTFTGDGSITMKIGKSDDSGTAFNKAYGEQSGGTFVGLMFRGVVNNNNNLNQRSPSVGFVVQNRYDTTGSYPNVRLVSRTSNSAVSNQNFQIPIMSLFYFGYIKLEKIGTNYKAYVSDDELTWIQVGSTISNNAISALNFGIAMQPGLSYADNVHLSNIKIYGFSATTSCTSTQYYSYEQTTPGCKTIPTFNQCGDNSWRTRVIGTNNIFPEMGGSDQNPAYSFAATTATLSKAGFTALRNGDVYDGMQFAFKEVSGEGTIIARVDSGSYNAPVGVAIRQELQGRADIENAVGYAGGGIMSACGHKTDTKGFHFYRTAANAAGVLVQTESNVGSPRYVKLQKSGTTFTCSFSQDGTTYTTIGSATVPITGTFYVGLAKFGLGTYQSITATYRNIDIIGFSGYCNNNGDCKTDDSGNIDKCNCNTGWAGTYCQTPSFSCYSIDKDDPTVCSGRGTCTSTDNCVCTQSSLWGGNQCQTPKCNNILAGTAGVCNGRGSCGSPNSCTCNSGYSGNDCEFIECFGKLSNAGDVCSAHGSCTSPDICTCTDASQYTGDQCQTPKCNGLIDPNACSGTNGTCSSPNTCSCAAGHGGTNCEYIICNGKLSNDVTVCNGQGSCQNPDSCVCNAGYTGTDCQTNVCFGSIDPAACFGTRGTCNAPNTCGCTTGYGGNECQYFVCDGKLSNDPTVCSSHGSCTAPDTCSCSTGYEGNICQNSYCNGQLDPIACSGGNGTCVSPNSCDCSTGFTGTNCEYAICNGKQSNDVSVCSSNGRCIAPNTCLCDSTHQGNDCQNPVCYDIPSTSTSQVCSGNGTCVSPNNCVCSAGYFGDQCNIYTCSGKLSNDSTVCSSHGNCIGKEQCFCDTGYTGNNCEFNICNGKSSNDAAVCSSHGTCISPNNCQCQPGWTDNDCGTITCVDVNSCSGQGTCVGPNNCSCNSQYTGSNCSIPICFGLDAQDSKVCSGNGECTSPNTCICSAGGYSGTFCNITVCDEVGDCTGHGLCVGANNCSCFAGWQNSNCSTFNCNNENDCSGAKGTCVGPNQCSCTPQWSGSNCASPVCYSISALNSSVCSGHGTCTNPDTCSCSPGWTGIKCEIAICNSINATQPNVCNSRGSCPLPNNCTCNTGYDGNDCQFNVCNGVSSGLAGVCSAHGSCTAPDNCVCNIGQYDGNNCQFPICYLKSANLSNSCTSITRGSCVAPNNCSCNSGYNGNECQNNICFGFDSSQSTVCSSHGNCTAPDTCQCQPSYYGHSCQFSDLYDFVNATCTTGCTFNKLTFKTCTDTGPSCYCNQNFGSSRIECDSTFAITKISFINQNFSGALPTMMNFTSLQVLDLSQNKLFSTSNFVNILPSSLKRFNFSYNDISNSGIYYEIDKTNFTNFNSLIMDGNRGCGIYPETWIENTFSVSTINHQKSYWCDTLDPNACTKVPLNIQNYVMLPHETEITINYTVSSCSNYLNNTRIACQSTKADDSNSQVFEKTSASLSASNIVCSRNSFLTDIDQYLTMIWKYNSTLNERISTNLNLVNLPYASILDIDRHLIFSDNTGKTQTVILNVNQNMTRYRKDSSKPIKCGISTDGYFIDGYAVTDSGNQVSCSIQLSAPNTGEKKIILYENSEKYNVTLNSISFWLVNTKITTPEIYESYIGNIAFTDLTGTLLPGRSGQNYKLNNTQYSMEFPCTYSGGKILYCTKSSSVTYPGDIIDVPLSFYDGKVVIDTLQTVFYKKNKVKTVYPQAVLSGVTTDVFITFNASTLSTGLIGVKYYCVHQNGNYSATVLNSTTIKCLSVQNSTTHTFKFNIHAVYQTFDMILNEITFEFFTIQPNPIYPSGSVTGLSGSRIFPFSFTESISPLLKDSLECQLEDGTRITATRIDSNEFNCVINSAIHRNLTFWMIDTKGTRSQLSSNFISLYFFIFGAISYDTSTKQFGNTGVNYNTTVKLNVANIPLIYQNRVVCSFDGNFVSTSIVGTNTYGCSIYSTTAGFKSIGVSYKKINAYKVSNIHGTFKNELNLTYTTAITLNINYYFKHSINTLNLINFGEMKNDCSDIVVTFKGKEIERRVVGCNSISTTISFKIQEVDTGSVEGYIIYYGNPNANAKSISTVSTTYSIDPTVKTKNETILTLNNNVLSFGFLKLFTISKIDPVAALTTNSTVKLWNNYVNVDYSGKVKFETRFDSSKFDASFTNPLFESGIYATSGKKINITLWAVYIPTQEVVAASSNFIEFIFMDLVSTNYLYPFIDRFSQDNQNKNATVQLTAATNLFTDTGLNCRFNHNGISKYSKATFVGGNAKLVECLLTVDSLNSNSEFITFDLYMNVSTENTNLNFILTSNNLTYVYLKEPIQIVIPATITDHYFNQNFTLNFTDAQNVANSKVSFNQYKLKLTPEYSSTNPSKYLHCEFNSLSPECMIQDLSLTHTPMRLDYQLQVTSAYFSDVVNFTMNSNIFKSNVTFVSALPYVGDTLKHKDSSLTAEFNISKKLHPGYNFYCEIRSKQVPIVKNLMDERLFSCSFNSTGSEEDVRISLNINDASVVGLSGIISNEDSIVQMVKLQFVPEYSNFPASTSLSVRRNNSVLIAVPSNYRSYPHKIVSTDGNEFSCTVGSGDGFISCSKTSIPTQSAVDIYLLKFKIQYQKPLSGFSDLVDVNQGLILYENHEITNIFPLAALVGNNLNLTLTFNESAMKNSFTQKIDFYCEYNTNGSLAQKVNDKVLNCPVTYNDHKSIPQLSGEKEIFITTNPSTTTFYYLTPTDIEFSFSDQTQFFYTATNVEFHVNITTFIPLNLVGNFATKLSDVSGFSTINNFTTNVGNTYQFRSVTSTTIGGKKQLSLWYKQDGYSFQLSNNTLDVVFAVKSLITGLSPVAAIVNRTNTLTITTAFDTSLDYGEANFTCKYGTNVSRYATTTPASILPGGVFSCAVTGTVEQKAFISIWMTAKGLERKITILDETFQFISSDFLNPSYGFATGNQNVEIGDYQRVPSNITFTQPSLDSKYYFLCDKVNSSLKCISPALPAVDAPPFASYKLRFAEASLSSKNLSVFWIIYEEREIVSYYPQVVSVDDATFPINITMNQELTLVKGELVLVFASTTNLRQDNSFGQLSNTVQVQKSITPLDGATNTLGTYEIQLYYKNEDSIEFRSMFAISKAKNITILEKSTTEFLVGTNNVGYVNQLTNFTVVLTNDVKMLTEQKPRVQCKVGNTFVTTYFTNDNQYICSTSSNVEGVNLITLWYRDSNAYNGEILISSNALDIVFIDYVNVTSVLPFAAIAQSQSIQLNSTLSNDFYGNKVTYECVFDGASSTATLSGSYFDCDISTVKTSAFFQFVTVNVKSVATGKSIPLTLNQDQNSQFYFLKQISTVSMFPFSLGHKITGSGSLISSVTIDIASDLLLTRGVFCQYSSLNDGILLSKAEYVGASKSKLSCTIDKTTFSNVVEVLNITLWMNASRGSTFSITSNDEKFLFIREPLLWNSSRVLNEFDVSNIHGLQFAIPNGNFNFQLNMTPNIDTTITSSVDCDYTNSIPNCLIKGKNLETVTSFPSHLNFTFYVSHKTSGINSQGFSVDYFTYYRNLTLEHLKPFIISYHERKYQPVRLISNVKNSLNQKFTYKCNFTLDGSTEYKTSAVTFDLKSYEYQANLNQSSHFACTFTTFGTAIGSTMKYNMKLIFVSELGEIELTGLPAVISAAIESPALFSSTGSALGGYPLQASFGGYQMPTSYYSSYNFTFGVYVGDNYISMSCSGTGLISCIFPNVQNSFSSWNGARKFLVDLRLDGTYALNIIPYFTAYPFFNIYSVSPSNYMKIGRASKIRFATSSFEFPGNDINFKVVKGSLQFSEGCIVESSEVLICSIPSVSEVGTYELFTSIDKKNFQSLGKKLQFFDDSNITISSTSKTDLSFISNTEIYIVGLNFMNTSDIQVSFFDDFVNQVSKGVYINSTHIYAKIDPFYNLDVQFPRTLMTKVSFNNGDYYTTSKVSVTISRSANFAVSPSLLVLGVKSQGIKITGLQKELIHYNNTKNTLGSRLYYNSTYFVELNCTNFDSCSLLSHPTVSGLYTVKLGLLDDNNNWNDMYLYAQNQITVFDFKETNITSIDPKNIMIQNSSNPMVINGNFKSFTSALFRFTLINNVLFAVENTVVVVPGTISDSQVTAIIPTSNAKSVQVDVSFNGGVNYDYITNYQNLLSPYTLESVSPDKTPEIQNLVNFLSTRDLSGTIKGTGFNVSASMNEVKLILKNSEGVYDITSIANIKIKSSTEISFTSPKTEKLNIKYQINYPFTLSLGLTFNNGHDYQYLPFTYENSFPQPLLTGINPTFSLRRDLNVTFFGLNLPLGKNCSIYSNSFNAKSGLELYYSPPITVSEGNSSSILCPIPESLTKNRSSLYITMKNQQGEINTNGFTIEFFEAPTLTSTIPTSSPSFGGLQITIFGNGIIPTRTSAPFIYCKFGNILCEKTCERIDDNSLICDVQQHPPGEVVFSMSYNKIDWHPVNSTTLFTYLTCDAGYTATNYKQPCELCPPGAYKPTRGLYECLKCENGTFNPFAGATFCEKCPGNTTGISIGSTSHTDCLCDENFYVNPNYDQHAGANEKCISCPSGAFCNFNTTEPLALPGFYNFKTNFNNFYSCIPKKSCGGFAPENCTTGYRGIRCGQCEDNWYKFRNQCGPCVKIQIKFVKPVTSGFVSDDDDDLDEEEKKQKKKSKAFIAKLIRMIKNIFGMIDPNDEMFQVKDVPWDVDYDYKPMNFFTDSETPEENFSTMNDIFYDLLSWQRIGRKIFLIRRKGQKTSSKIVKKFSKKSEEDKEVEAYIKQLQKDDPEYAMKLKKFKSKHGSMSKDFEKVELKKRKSQYRKSIQEEKRKSQLSSGRNSSSDPNGSSHNSSNSKSGSTRGGGMNLADLQAEIAKEDARVQKLEKGNSTAKLLSSVKKSFRNEKTSGKELEKKKSVHAIGTVKKVGTKDLSRLKNASRKSLERTDIIEFDKSTSDKELAVEIIPPTPTTNEEIKSTPKTEEISNKPAPVYRKTIEREKQELSEIMMDLGLEPTEDIKPQVPPVEEKIETSKEEEEKKTETIETVPPEEKKTYKRTEPKKVEMEFNSFSVEDDFNDEDEDFASIITKK
eukprot:gene2809-4217_t